MRIYVFHAERDCPVLSQSKRAYFKPVIACAEFLSVIDRIPIFFKSRAHAFAAVDH